MRKIFSATVLMLIIGLPGVRSGDARAETSATRHDRAIAAYRAGRGDEAIRILDGLRQSQPRNTLYLYDSIRILSALERDREALTLFAQVDSRRAPVDVLAAAAKSARNLQQFDRAIELYQLAIASRSQDLQLRLGLALTLADAGKATQAVERIRAIVDDPHHGTRLDVNEANAYILERANLHPAAAAAYRRILRLAPDNEQAWRGLTFNVSKMGAAHLAASLAEQRTALFSQDELKRLRSDRAAAQIRWGDVPPISNATRFAETDRALAFLDEVHGRSWDQLNLDDAADRRLAFDRMIALRDRVRMPEVIVLYERLESEGVEVPAWSLIAAADAYLYLEQPESAIPIYLEVLRKDPSNPNVPLSLFYAYEDLNDHDAALATIDAYAASQPVWTTDANAGGIVPNGRKANADITAAMGRAYADRLADAQRELERMSSAAPANLGLHGSLGSVYLWRGWPERAKREFDQLIAAEPEGRIGRVGKASTMLTAREFPDAESEIDSLRADFPENKHVQRLQRRWEIINRREAYNETRVGFADGRDFDGSSVANDFYLFASPMAYNFRPYLHDHLATADVREGVAFDHRMGVGLEYAAPKVVARTEVFQGLADNDGTGWSGTARWFVDDHWQVSGNAAVNTMDVPLRGIRAGVDGEQVGGGVTYRWHESQEAGVAYNHFFFSDGNDRDAWNGYFARRLITGPYHKLTATLGAYTSSNSRNDVIYFSPERDYSTSLTVEHLWNAYRRYERKFNQRIAGTVGGYWQEGFDAGPLWSVLYEHQWALDDTLGFNYGYVHNRRVYDGVGEDEDALYGNVDWRF